MDPRKWGTIPKAGLQVKLSRLIVRLADKSHRPGYWMLAPLLEHPTWAEGQLIEYTSRRAITQRRSLEPSDDGAASSVYR
jgi:hypothetical protein